MVTIRFGWRHTLAAAAVTAALAAPALARDDGAAASNERAQQAVDALDRRLAERNRFIDKAMRSLCTGCSATAEPNTAKSAAAKSVAARSARGSNQPPLFAPLLDTHQVPFPDRAGGEPPGDSARTPESYTSTTTLRSRDR